MAAAPLRAPGGEVIGTLAISSATPRTFDAEELDLLQGLADQAAIAITNSTLLTRLTESEERYRYLVENAPDLVWSIGPDTRLTFVSDSVERMTGFRPDELIGRHFGALVHESSREVADFDWASGMGNGSQELRGRVNMLARDGSPIPAEFIATARLDETGTFVGANGSVRDMRERDRLERELQASEARFRNLVQTSPDVIYRCDAEGRFLFMAEGSEALFGWTPAEVAGKTFADFTADESLAEALANFEIQQTEHDVVRRFRYLVKYRDGTTFPAEITSVSVWEDGLFAGVQGTVRDVTQQERLERELRESQERYRFLVENSPGRRLLDRRRRQVHVHVRGDGADDRLGARGGHRRTFLATSSSRPACPTPATRWAALVDRSDHGAVARHQPPGTGRQARPRSRSARSGWSTPRAGSRASTARPVTSASATGSNASCANPRSAIATSSPRRRTSSG